MVAETTSNLRVMLERKRGEQFRPARPDEVAGIGPVISGWHDNRPCYWFDQVHVGGAIERRVWWKASRAADRSARSAAVAERSMLTDTLRKTSCVMLLHDEATFNCLVSFIRHGSIDLPTARRKRASPA